MVSQMNITDSPEPSEMEKKESKRESILVFGSNLQGFHGAGDAGVAMRGVSENTWRQDPVFLRAMKAALGHKDRIGLRAVYGIAEGLQQGTEGKGWAIPTVTRPGAKRSISLDKIKLSLKVLWQFATQHAEYDFTFTPLGCGYAGYTKEEMLKVIQELDREITTPSNLSHVVNTYKSS